MNNPVNFIRGLGRRGARAWDAGSYEARYLARGRNSAEIVAEGILNNPHRTQALSWGGFIGGGIAGHAYADEGHKGRGAAAGMLLGNFAGAGAAVALNHSSSMRKVAGASWKGFRRPL